MTRRSEPRVVFSADEMVGRATSHIITSTDLPFPVHRAVLRPFLRLRQEALRAGFDLWPVSAFRDFDHQRRIWNGKWRGERPLLGRAGEPLDAAALSPAARVRAILVWSAVPGASRHHWGTELDVYDRAAVPAGYRPGLTVEEYAADGPFGPLADWLERRMEAFGFYRPYRHDRGGVLPEPWHLSHFPTAREASRRLRLATLARVLQSAEVEGRAALLKGLPVIYRRYVRNVESPPRQRPTAAAGGARRTD
jgi:LAS superfamily LD-carboxypeptidase LdcB